MTAELIMEKLQEIGEIVIALIICGIRWLVKWMDVIAAIGAAVLICGAFWWCTSMLALMCEWR